MITRADCERLDRDDPLAALRARFELPAGIAYLDGNSLGALPKKAALAVRRATEEEWGKGLIGSWLSADWIGLSRRVGDKLAPLIGAAPDEVIAADSTSINLYKLLCAAAELRPDRRIVLTDTENFPTDHYMVKAVADRYGKELRRVAPDEIASALSPEVAVLSLTHVNYKTAEIYDMAGLTAAAHRAGVLTVWDLAHTAGAVPCDLGEARADFAVGCGYKYLNGGPGAPAFLFVRRDLIGACRNPLSGWFGHADPFSFSPDHVAAEGIERFLCGTTQVLGMTALDAALDVFAATRIDALRAKSTALTETFIALADARLAPLGFRLASPREAARRGSHVSIAHENGYAIMRCLIERGFVGDFRAPDLLRFGFAPLYNRFVEAFDTVEAIIEIVRTGAWQRPELATRARVT